MILNTIKNIEFKLPTEWIQMFRTLLSIYLTWLILFTPRKPLFTDNIFNKILFVGLLIVLTQSDIISAMLLIMIYFLSFQPILPMDSDFDSENFLNRPIPIPDMMDENLRRSYEYIAPTPTPIVYNFYQGLLKKEAYDKKTIPG